jgi:hypothetical protein
MEVDQTQPIAAVRTGEVITCPECGTIAEVQLNRRQAEDFCRTCDYPLFWVPSEVVLGDGSQSAEQALRRLPGTAGRAAAVARPCPHCAEPNVVSAVTCIRCGRPMVLPPPPPPVVVAPPPPPPPPAEPEPEPEPRSLWWLWAALAVIGLILLVIVLVIVD